MTATETQFDIRLAELTQEAFDAFCDDISGMFDCPMQTIEQKTLRGPITQLQKEFKRVASINTVDINGILDGQFAIWFDQAAIFILSGIVVMLPENRIRDNVKSGGIKEAQSLTDAIKELGNLMTGSWDRIFREGLTGHKHLKQNAVFIGQPWQKPAELKGLDTNTECLIVTAKIKVGNFEPVLCAAVYPAALLEPKPEPQPEPVAEKPVSEVPAAQAVQPPAEKESAPAPAAKVETVVQPVQPSAVSRAIEELIRPMAEKTPCGNSFPAAVSTKFDLNSPVQTICNPNPVWIDPDSSIQQAIRLMQQYNTGYLLAGKNGQLEGILSRSDVAAAVSPYTKSVFAGHRRPLDDASFQLRCKWFLSRPVRAIPAETPAWTAIDMMCKYAVRSLVILDAKQNVSGLVTTFDILRNLISMDQSVLAGAVGQTPPCMATTNVETRSAAVN